MLATRPHITQCTVTHAHAHITEWLHRVEEALADLEEFKPFQKAAAEQLRCLDTMLTIWRELLEAF